MKLTPNQRKGAGFVLVGVLGFFTGHWLPPEVLAELVGAFA
ncbi:hypothetical protein QLQ85_08815 [Halomonas sp. M4R5S39]|nr:hypothetical protein [Halomonas kalidii]MDI5984891.1 hypothetical protein [Halomonas kalidii]